MTAVTAVTAPADIRILAADDHSLLREALCDLLELTPGLTVVGQTGDGAEAVRLAAALRPDLVLLDLDMPGPGPVATVRALHAAVPGVRVVVLTMHGDSGLVGSLLEAGAAGFLHKGVERNVLVAAIRGAMAGDTTVIYHRDQAGAAPGPAPSTAAPTPTTETLTVREREVLMCVAQAMSNRQIARTLAIAEGTVKRHLRNIFDKLGATSRLDAVNKGLHQEAGVVTPRPRQAPAPALRPAGVRPRP
ncbi:DNA-binding response regulator [Streptomyces mashuensis]|uniref:DNA-binding response regulator n=1 Tax=Streptomyces mashuensis TaxID=33904 RepID=A0A919B3F3_9ACTN|nr:response regulator transcription factor [Streptomyces mashuensis]GHF42002.1 DNA-binding response regulator [Streptomyces mashuensis]